MKINLLPALSFLSLLALNSSCEKTTPEPEVLPAGPLTITLKPDQTQVNGALAVKVVSVREGRCAREECYRCIGGYATVQVDLTVANQAPQRVTFQRVSCMAPNDLTLANADSVKVGLQHVAGYRIGLINMTDLVRASATPVSDYELKFLLVKK